MKKLYFLVLFIGHSWEFFAQNVGIGTLNPLEKLSVVSNYGYGISHEANSIKLSSYIDAGGAYWGTVSNHPLHVYTNNGAAQATFSNNGFLGLGIMQPEYRLDMAGRMRIRTGTIGNIFTTSGIFMEDYRNGSPRIFFGMQDSIRLGIYGEGTPGVAWGFNFNARNGNVGIGVLNPVNKLEVDGTVKASDFRYHSPKTHYYSMPPSAFVVKSTRLGNSEFAAVFTESDDYGGSVFQYIGNSQGFAAPVNLPHGATISGLKVYFVDDSPTDNLRFQLRRRLHEGEFYLTMCTITSSGTPGNSNISNSTIGFAVIDNQNYNYTLSVVPEPNGYWAGLVFQIKSVLISYTMPAPE